MRKTINIIITLFIGINSITAQQVRLESDRFLYWQIGTNIRFEDFKQKPDSNGIRLCEKYGTKSLVNVQIHSILDYPKNARKIKTLEEKVYFAPSFCKDCSMLVQKDSSELEMAQMFFDIAEYCSRRARQNIKHLDSLNHTNGFIAAAFPGIVDNMYKMMGEMFGAFGRQVSIEKKPGAFEKWRSDCDKLLFQTKDYATSKEECLRLINQKPYSDDYKEIYSKYGRDLK
jgi:hypothetical protein